MAGMGSVLEEGIQGRFHGEGLVSTNGSGHPLPAFAAEPRAGIFDGIQLSITQVLTSFQL